MPKYGIDPLFNVQNPADRAMGGMDSASRTMASLDKKGPEAPGKTVGGGVMNAMGGYMTGSAMTAAGMAIPGGAPLMAGVAAAAYFLS
jgi:hypothetical protein